MDGFIHVSVMTREPSPLESAGRTEASIEITDNGMGISKNALPRVFDMFVQSRICDASREGGLGIGLAVVKHLVSQHDGTVEIKSDGEGCGTTVLIRLPVRAPRTEASSDYRCIGSQLSLLGRVSFPDLTNCRQLPERHTCI